MVARPGWTCHPAKSWPSYASVSFKLRDKSCYLKRKVRPQVFEIEHLSSWSITLFNALTALRADILSGFRHHACLFLEPQRSLPRIFYARGDGTGNLESL